MKNYLIFPIFIFVTFFSGLSFSQEQPNVKDNDLSKEQENFDLFYSDLEDHPSSKHDESISNEHTTSKFEYRLLNMLLMLITLITFMVLAGWALKRMMRSRINNLNTSSVIKIKETRNISPRSTLYLVEIEGQTLLIGETHQTITHLATLETQSE